MKNYLADYHIHTTYCDGKNTAEEIAARAYELGFKTLGFSVHGYTDFDESFCIPKARIPEYKAEIAALGDKYRGRMEILCGVEADMYSNEPTDGFDYVIGSSHYMRVRGRYIATDISADDMRALIGEYPDGFAGLAEEYYGELSRLFTRTRADIIGHFDLITKFKNRLSLTLNDRYYDAAFSAAEALVTAGKPFEINVGAIARGYRSSPYPDAKILRRIHELGGEIIITGDCHRADNLGKNLDIGCDLARECGFSHRLILSGGEFKRIAL